MVDDKRTSHITGGGRQREEFGSVYGQYIQV